MCARAMDYNGLSDPYVTARVGTRWMYRTKTVSRNLNPHWNETTSLELLYTDRYLVIDVWDQDSLSKDDIMGRIVFSLATLPDRTQTMITLPLEQVNREQATSGTVTLVCTVTWSVQAKAQLEQEENQLRHLQQHLEPFKHERIVLHQGIGIIFLLFVFSDIESWTLGTAFSPFR